MVKKTGNQVYQFKITLKGIRPPIWRRIQVPDTYSFWDLHVAIQDAMGWMDYHMHEFIVLAPSSGDRVRIGVPDPEYGAQTVLPEEKHSIGDWFSPEGDPALYTYDFGDDWEHMVKLEKILPREEDEDYPRCVGGKRACPPEDCGGPWGYRHMLEVLADPGNEEYEDMMEWLVDGFEPELFHPDGIVFMDPDIRRRYLEGSWGATAAGPRGTGLEEESEAYADPGVIDLLERIRSEELPLLQYKDELDALMPHSILAAAAAVDEAVDGYGRGKIRLEEAEEVIRNQADLHPLHPFLFEMCAVYALPHVGELDIFGYMALTVIKSERLRELTGEDFNGDTPDSAPAGFRELMKQIGESEELLQAHPYIAKCGDHVVNHFLVEEILGSHWEVDEDVLSLALERNERVAPIAIAMCEDLLAEVEPDLLPFGMVYLLRLIGCLKVREALPMLMQALQECRDEPLHEALLALAKLGSLHPDEVSSGLRGVAADPACREERLAAVEVLGLLGKEAGNFDFLRERLLGLDPDDPYYYDMFAFLVQALASSGHGKAREIIGAALEAHGPAVPDGAAAFARAFLDDPGFMGISCRLEDFAEEDMSDLRELELDFDVDMRRSTMTREREEDLEPVEEDEEERLPNLAWVEEQLRTRRNDPCPCGSGLKFKKCCLQRLEELRDILLRGESGESEPGPRALLEASLAVFARELSLAAERETARDEFLGELGRSRFGEGGVEGADLLEEAVFDDWFLFSRPLRESGKTVVEEFAAARGPDLEVEVADALRGLLAARFSVYEIENVGAGRRVRLRDAFRNERFEVCDEEIGLETMKGELLVGMLGMVGERPELFGNIVYAPGDFLQELERFVSEKSEKAIGRGEAANRDEYLRRSWHHVLYEVMRLYE